MRRRIEPQQWTPAGGLTLEPEALLAVQSSSNAFIVAGPGAGKTELLAQRTCYLLQTGICSPPHRILAICFKRDAAKNLRDRVQRRLGWELARYFDSQTFDAFSKGLLDRFRLALPLAFRCTSDYQIDFLVRYRMRQWLDTIATSANLLTETDVSQILANTFYLDHLVGSQLGDGWDNTSEGRATAALWRTLLGAGSSRLDFGMIGRLVELLLRTNPKLLRAIRRTYSYVLLDEFQDTTRVQYDLLTTAFLGSRCVLTAVGDGKQRIMGFAGAASGVFEQFQQDFAARPYRLVMNYRSAPELVRIQRVIIESLEPGTPPATARPELPEGSGECTVHVFSDYRQEASVLAELCQQWLSRDGLRPRDICVLAREKPGNYAHLLVDALQVRGIRARDESERQDLLAEPLTVATISILRLSLQERHPSSWETVMALMEQIRGLDEDDPRARQVAAEVRRSGRRLGEDLRRGGNDAACIQAHLESAISLFGERAFKQIYLQYAQGDFYSKTLSQIALGLADSYQRTGDWVRMLDDFEGANAIPILTIHKSKGLEYHTVIFMGLEDAAFRNFANESDEERRAFFVAFSRAKQRVLFTVSQVRARSRRDSAVRQSVKGIRSLYDLLRQAQVRIVDHRPPKDPATT